MLELTIVYLWGKVLGVTFKMPGADGHSRWMSEVLYDLKIELLSNVFHLSHREKSQVDDIAEFPALLYVM